MLSDSNDSIDLAMMDDLLHLAISICADSENWDNQKPILDCLIENGANVNSEEKCGWPALWSALFLNSQHIVDYLIQAGADVNMVDKKGLAVFHKISTWHFSQETKNVAGLLIKHNADIHVRDKHGNTPLHYAAYANTAKFLLKNGARLDMTNDQGRYPDETMLQLLGRETVFVRDLRKRRLALDRKLLSQFIGKPAIMRQSRARM